MSVDIPIFKDKPDLSTPVDAAHLTAWGVAIQANADAAEMWAGIAAATQAVSAIVMPGVSGVVGDGVTYDTAAIQAIIDALPVGGIVYWAAPGGGNASYLVTSLTVTTANVRFVNGGRDVYAVNIKGTASPVITVKAPGFVLDGVGVYGDSDATNGVGATIEGLDLYGDTDGNIDARIVGASFQGLAVGVRVRARNADIAGCMVTNCLSGVVFSGPDGTYHTGPNAGISRGNRVRGARFHNIGAASTTAAIDILPAAKILHAEVSDNYFDSNGLAKHIRVTGASGAGNAHEKISFRGNKHTECAAEPYELTYVNNSTIRGADIAGYAVGNPATYHGVKLMNCDTITVSGMTGIQISGSGIYARSTARLFVRDVTLRVMGFGTATTGHGVDADSTVSDSQFDHVYVNSADGWGFTGSPTDSTMTDCKFVTCTLGLIDSTTLTNRVTAGLNSYVEGKFGRVEDRARKPFDLAATTATDVATVTGGGNYSSFFVRVRFSARSGGTDCVVAAERAVRTENGAPVFTTIGTDTAVGCTVAFATNGSSSIKITLTAAVAASGVVMVETYGGGAANTTNPRSATVAML